MKIMNRIHEKANDNANKPGVTIAFLGDSVTQGCFELYKKSDGSIETVFDKTNAYHTYLNRILSLLYPSVPVNIINAGISGDNATHGFERLERDVLQYSPDLVVVCFGLNDAMAGLTGISQYKAALKNIFLTLQKETIETIFMTPNMMNTYVSSCITDADCRAIAEASQSVQNSAVLEKYLSEAHSLCIEYNIPVCDCYLKWKKLYENGVDTTMLLANRINHPVREMNWLFAVSLIETMMN